MINIRYLGYLAKQFKSKRHVEANLCNRYRKAKAGFFDGKNATLAQLCSLTITTPEVHADSFPKRARGKTYTLTGSDLEELHDVFKVKFPLYERLWQVWDRTHPDQATPPGTGISTWAPWNTAVNADSRAAIPKSFQCGQTQVSLQAALLAFRFLTCRKIMSGVWHAGEKRQGCGVSVAPHQKAQSVFQFVSGDEFSFGRVLFFFGVRVQIPGTDAQLLRFAKVQILHFTGLSPKCNLPVLSMHSSNKEVIVETRRIGKVIVCAKHPDQTNFTPTDFLLLPWPRHMHAEC